MPEDFLFNGWMKEVDTILAKKLMGLTSNDLPDCPYRDWWDDEVTPQQAANRAMLMAGDEDGEEDDECW